MFRRASAAAFFLHSAAAMMRGLVMALVVAAGLVTAAGCNTSVAIGTSCPAAMPAPGAACDEARGEYCTYQDGPCVVAFTCAAEEGTWQTDGTTCTPAAVDCWSASEGDVCATPGETCGEGGGCGGFENWCGEDHRWHTAYYDGGDCCYDECWDPCDGWYACPATQPVEGDYCEPYCPGTSSCTYPSTCGNAYATCGDDGKWHVAIPDCPPPPVDPCTTIGTQADCESSGCRWLVPGCGEPALPQAGCYAPTDCTPADCVSPYSTCKEVVIDPCWNKGCNACGMNVSLCLP